LPGFITNATSFNSSTQLLQWNGFPADNSFGWDGFSLLVDDVQRLVGDVLNFSLTGLDATVPHFFRLAVCFFKTIYLMSSGLTYIKFQQGGASGDYTKAATLWPNGTWVDPLPGPA
jgi:hypothetical protein